MYLQEVLQEKINCNRKSNKNPTKLTERRSKASEPFIIDICSKNFSYQTGRKRTDIKQFLYGNKDGVQMPFFLTSVAPEMKIPWLLLSLICRLSLDKSRRSLKYKETKRDSLLSSILQKKLYPECICKHQADSHLTFSKYIST